MARFRKNPDHPRQRVNLTIDPVIYTGAQELAYAEGVSVSEMVNQLLRASLDASAADRMKAAKESAGRREEAAKGAARKRLKS